MSCELEVLRCTADFKNRIIAGKFTECEFALANCSLLAVDVEDGIWFWTNECTGRQACFDGVVGWVLIKKSISIYNDGADSSIM